MFVPTDYRCGGKCPWLLRQGLQSPEESRACHLYADVCTSEVSLAEETRGCYIPFRLETASAE